MINPVRSIINSATRDNSSKLKILNFVTHERYQENIGLIDAEFYTLQGNGSNGIRNWNLKVSSIPKSFNILPKDFKKLPIDLDVDIIISDNRLVHLDIAKQIRGSARIPILNCEHCFPVPSWNENVLLQIKNQKQADKNVFITEINRDYWGYNEDEGVVIEHGIQSNVFKPDPNIERKSHILNITNDFIARDWCCGYSVWKRVTEGLPVKVIGETPGLSKGSESLEETIKEYQSSQIYINVTPYSPISMSTLEAMSCGCAIISVATGLMPEIIEHEKNGLISNDEKTLKKYCRELINNPEWCRVLGENARKTILERFSIDRFVNQWNDLLWKTVEGYR